MFKTNDSTPTNKSLSFATFLLSAGLFLWVSASNAMSCHQFTAQAKSSEVTASLLYDQVHRESEGGYLFDLEQVLADLKGLEGYLSIQTPYNFLTQRGVGVGANPYIVTGERPLNAEDVSNQALSNVKIRLKNVLEDAKALNESLSFLGLGTVDLSFVQKLNEATISDLLASLEELHVNIYSQTEDLNP